MPALAHSVTYQGYPASAFSLRWDAGLSPSTGYVDLNLADVEKIMIDVKVIPWGGNVYPGMMSIKAFQSAKPTTQAESPGAAVHQGPGFGNFGDLELKTFDGQGAWHTPITYKRIFIAESGVEEIQRDLATARQHKEGKIRVQLTDVRMFYHRYGALLQRFNCRRPGGEFDQITLKRKKGSAQTADGQTGNRPDVATGGGPGTGPRVDFSGAATGNQTVVGGAGEDSFVPWTIQEIMRFLFAQLPGSPSILPQSDLMKDTLEDPIDIIGEGEPIVEWISKLLGQYGYEAHMMPDSQTYLIMRLGKKAEYGKIAVGPDQWESITDCHYERKTVWLKNRPPAVSVIGKRRVRRTSTFYVPVFQSSDDGMIYKLSAVESVYGYPLSKLNKQVMVGHEKNFRDVPPLGTRKGFMRGQSLRKCAYKMYAPAGAFPDGKNRVTLQDLQRQPFMPMKKCPVYLDELKAWMGMEEDVDDKQEGDRGPFALVAPIVRAYRYGKGFFRDFQAMKTHFDAVLSYVDRELNWANQAQQWIDLRDAKPGLGRSQEDLLKGLGAVEKYFSKLSADSLRANFDHELVRQAALAGLLDPKVAAQIMEQEQQEIMRRPNKLEKELAEAAVSRTRAWRRAVQNQFANVQRAFEKGGVELAKCQLPWGMVPRGGYSINTQTGILMMNEPAVRCLQPFMLDVDNGEVYADGAVTVTFGYELNSNTPMDYTTVTFCPDAANPDEKAKPVCVALAFPTAMPAHVELASNMQLYEDQTGVPFNKAACISEAANYVEALKTPQRVDGYTYELDGLRKAVLEGGVSTIEHRMEETGLAYTHVYVNAPYVRRMLPGRIPRAWVESVDSRRRIETSKGNEDQ